MKRAFSIFAFAFVFCVLLTFAPATATSTTTVTAAADMQVGILAPDTDVGWTMTAANINYTDFNCATDTTMRDGDTIDSGVAYAASGAKPAAEVIAYELIYTERGAGASLDLKRRGTLDGNVYWTATNVAMKPEVVDLRRQGGQD